MLAWETWNRMPRSTTKWIIISQVRDRKAHIRKKQCDMLHWIHIKKNQNSDISSRQEELTETDPGSNVRGIPITFRSFNKGSLLRGSERRLPTSASTFSGGADMENDEDGNRDSCRREFTPAWRRETGLGGGLLRAGDSLTRRRNRCSAGATSYKWKLSSSCLVTETSSPAEYAGNQFRRRTRSTSEAFPAFRCRRA